MIIDLWPLKRRAITFYLNWHITEGRMTIEELNGQTVYSAVVIWVPVR